MSTETQIKDLISKLYPTGRVWNHITDNETQEIIVTFTDGTNDVPEDYTDGVGNPYTLATGSENTFGKKVFIAESRSWVRLYDDAIAILNGLIADNEYFDETDATNWERVLGLFISGLTLEERKTAILRKQNYPNGIFERAYRQYVEDQLQAAGFDVYVHENRFEDGSGGWEVVDPDDLAGQAYQLGFFEFGVAEFGGQSDGFDYTIVANHIDEDEDSTFFDIGVNEIQLGQWEFGVGQFQTGNSISRQEQLRYSFFIGGSVWPSIANVSLDRKNEFRQLILTLKQLHNVVFLLINYI